MLAERDADAIVATVRRVGAEVILPRFRALGADQVDAKSAFDDLVTVADREAETALTRDIGAILPGAAIIGEEAVSADPGILDRVGAERAVILDPIDGTWNFAHGLANFGVIVAVLEAGVTVWGLLYDPGFDDWIVAHRGGGAWFHRGGTRRRLRTDPAERPFAQLRGNLNVNMAPEAERAALAATVPLFRRTPSLGASLHEYRQLASGGSDFCLNAMLNVWDHAAGVLILSEAGGCSRLLDGRAYAPAMRQGRLLSARTPALWDRLAETFGAAIGIGG